MVGNNQEFEEETRKKLEEEIKQIEAALREKLQLEAEVKQIEALLSGRENNGAATTTQQPKPKQTVKKKVTKRVSKSKQGAEEKNKTTNLEAISELKELNNDSQIEALRNQIEKMQASQAKQLAELEASQKELLEAQALLQKLQPEPSVPTQPFNKRMPLINPLLKPQGGGPRKRLSLQPQLKPTRFGNAVKHGLDIAKTSNSSRDLGVKKTVNKLNTQKKLKPALDAKGNLLKPKVITDARSSSAGRPTMATKALSVRDKPSGSRPPTTTLTKTLSVTSLDAKPNDHHQPTNLMSSESEPTTNRTKRPSKRISYVKKGITVSFTEEELAKSNAEKKDNATASSSSSSSSDASKPEKPVSSQPRQAPAALGTFLETHASSSSSSKPPIISGSATVPGDMLTRISEEGHEQMRHRPIHAAPSTTSVIPEESRVLAGDLANNDERPKNLRRAPKPVRYSSKGIIVTVSREKP